MAEKKESKLEQAEIKKIVEDSRRMVEEKKKFFSVFGKDITRQEKVSAKRREEMTKSLRDVRIEFEKED